MVTGSREILTLEPFIQSVREGIEGRGWALSGLQKTTSQEFEGRWAGQSSRSAYLFFHRDALPDWVSVEAFLDETSHGLKGNLALVIDGPEVHELPPFETLLGALAGASVDAFPEGYRTPVSLRVFMDEPEDPVDRAETEYRFKLHLPKTALEAGMAATSALAASTAGAFEGLLGHPLLRHHLPRE